MANKYLIVSIFPEAMDYRAHADKIDKIVRDIALFNGHRTNNPDKYTSEETDNEIAAIFKTVNSQNRTMTNIKLVKTDETTFHFGHMKTNNRYVTYGKIIKISLL